MDAKKLQEVLEAHRLWLVGDVKGTRANLSGANLSGANLSGANLTNANLKGVNLRNANLKGADLKGADLRNADLKGANLSGADLSGADLSGADLRGANLTNADLRNADLRNADLSGANLRNANLRNANLKGADLSGANLKGADLSGAELPHFQICPAEGAFIAWKKVAGGAVLKLEILIDAKRTSSLIGRKCRASRVWVLEAFGASESTKVFSSQHDREFKYRIGAIVSVSDFDDDIRVECTSGIHFFMTRKEAEEY